MSGCPKCGVHPRHEGRRCGALVRTLVSGVPSNTGSAWAYVGCPCENDKRKKDR